MRSESENRCSQSTKSVSFRFLANLMKNGMGAVLSLGR